MKSKSYQSFLALLAALLVVLPALPVRAFCGFYVAQADTPLYNEASKVVLAWDDGQATVTMASDYRGEPREFGLVVPVPVVVARDDIRVVSMGLVDKLDAYSQPRMTEYYDADPCPPPPPKYDGIVMPAPMASYGTSAAAPSFRRGISIEAQYQVGVYDIVILKARESGDLVRYLRSNHYRIPNGAEEVLGSYIAQKMHFFLAKVNLDRQNAAGEKFLQPLQVGYRSPKFMLPIRLGTVNAAGPQDLEVLMLTRHGRVETVNYRTAQMPTRVDVPLYVREHLGEVYRAAFDRKVEQDGMSNVYTEYAWDLGGYCDPCSAPKPDSAELYALGARWHYAQFKGGAGAERSLAPVADEGYLTRLHVRYDRAHFPEDLAFEETQDRGSYQVVYSVHHPWSGNLACSAGIEYWHQLGPRFDKEVENLQSLTGWDQATIRAGMDASGEKLPPEPVLVPAVEQGQLRRSLFRRIVDFVF